MAADEIVLETDFTEPASITPLTTVGTVYDIAIDGTGYVLAESAEEGYEKTTIPLIPDRLATRALRRCRRAAPSRWPMVVTRPTSKT
jgi:hypothetical protein